MIGVTDESEFKF